MKIQCSCGAKYELDVTPAMLANPITFICASCGLDSSQFVNGLIVQELARMQPPAPVAAPAPAPAPMRVALPVAAPVAAPAPVAVPAPAPVAVAAPAPVPAGLRVSRAAEAPVAAESAPAGPAIGGPCMKHPDHATVDVCRICSRPICLKCMEHFGYLCSPLCKSKADSHGINVPIYSGQKSVVEARLWRRVGQITAGVVGVILLLLGVWTWYAWVGSTPRPVFSVRFPEVSWSGKSDFSGKNQIVFLHGSTLARYDMKTKKEVWSRDLVDHEAVRAAVAKEIKDFEAYVKRMRDYGNTRLPRTPNADRLNRLREKYAAEALELYVRSNHVWVVSSGKLTEYDFDSGKPGKEFKLPEGRGLMVRSNEVLLVESDRSHASVTHVNLATGDARTETIVGVAAAVPDNNAPQNSTTAPKSVGASARTQMAGLPTATGDDSGKPLDPAKVAQQVQKLSMPAKIALPATLSSDIHQEQISNAMKDPADKPAAQGAAAAPAQTFDNRMLVPGADGFVEMSVKLEQQRFTERKAMRDAPKKSVLDDNLTASKSLDAANEILNELQRSRGGDTVQEDESIYSVRVRQPGSGGPWIGKVVGSPSMYPLQTVNVVVGAKEIHVLSKDNQKLWDSKLSFNVPQSLGVPDPGNASEGQGPVAEHDGSLYVFDEGVLSAFDIKTGNARWRLPTVGVSGMFFGEPNTLYVNTTTGGHDQLKYSRQIDVNRHVSDVVQKIDTRTGKVLWSAEPYGGISYVRGKFIYSVQSRQSDDPDEYDEDGPSYDPDTAKPAFLRIKRLNPRNGDVMWEYDDQRAPFDVQFENNTIRLVFKKEVQVLRFLTF